ncbi:MAG TPA: phosphomannomutase/phosphoglucomutase [Actinomycetota bacterium]
MDIDGIFKAYDVRGLYPEQIDQEVAHRAGRAFVDFLGARRVIVGRDARASSEPLSTAFIAGVVAQGADVIDIGLASTDMLYFASGVLDAPGAMFTASHNPPKYNGIKMCRAGAAPIGENSGLLDIKEMVRAGDAAPVRRTGRIERREMLDDYVKHVLSFVNVDRLRPLVVVTDTANGMGGLTVPSVFAHLPFKLIPLYLELDGTFPNHPADPLQAENLRDLQDAVLRNGAAVGLAFDGDADRCFIVDEQARPVSGSLTAALVARSILRKNPGETVIHNIICSRVVPETIREHGGTPVRTRVGHSFVKKVMAETGAIFGGEHSGHYYFRDFWRADSGLVAALHVLEAISEENAPLSEVLAPLQRYWNSGEVNIDVAEQQAAMERVASSFSSVAPDWSDGLTIEFDDWWFNLRPSNTEPLLRLNVEAREAAGGQARRDEILAIVNG